jgi:hypothetical protein
MMTFEFGTERERVHYCLALALPRSRLSTLGWDEEAHAIVKDRVEEMVREVNAKHKIVKAVIAA